MNKIGAFAVGLASLLGTAVAGNAATINYLMFPLRPSVNGFIETDGTFGTLSQSNIVDFSITVTLNGVSGTITSANNTIDPFLVGNALSATPNDLIFDFTANGYLQFSAPSQGSVLFCGTGDLCFPNFVIQIMNSTGVQYLAHNPGGESIGLTPIPGAFPLFATGLGVLGLLGWRRKRKAIRNPSALS
jgi:hypothetical protein